MYGEDSAAREVLGRVSIETPTDRAGYSMRQELERRLGRSNSGSDYLLVADLRLRDSGLAITEDSSITRFTLRGRSRYALTGPEGVPPISGFVDSMSAYSATGSLYATRAAKRDAEERVARDLAMRIADRVTGALNARGSGQ